MKIAQSLLVLALLGAISAPAQKLGQSSGGSSTGGGTGTTPSPVAPTTPSAPNNPAVQQPPTVPTPSRPIFIAGTLIMDDGSQLPVSADIQSICGGTVRNVAHTGGNGNFSFQWNDTRTVFQDASMGSESPFTQQSPSSSNPFAGLDPTLNCELRASASGYTSSRVSLGDRSMSFNIDVGNIVLHRMTGDEGRTVSLTALKAPKNAVKSFDKGNSEVKARKLADAAVSFRKATELYPDYADAYLNLGKIEFQTGAKDAARTHFQKAMDLDSKMAGPWEQLGYMASDESKWEEAAKYLDQAVRLDPTDSPTAWYFNAVANYNLGHFDIAERSVRTGIRLNGDRNPRAQYLLGLVLIGENDLTAGADVLRRFVEKWPQAGDADAAKQQLSRIGTRISTASPQ
jgi:tetratricopeptide (TPR) repeat protein